MDELFARYERELVTMRQLCREYAERYPKVAAKLQMGGDACDDPHVERLIQSVALLCARVSKRLDDSYPQFTEALLNLLFPHYLRPFPIARLGDQVECPQLYPGGKPHGVNKIITAHPTLSVGGIAVAVEDCITECGCKLIGTRRASVG